MKDHKMKKVFLSKIAGHEMTGSNEDVTLFEKKNNLNIPSSFREFIIETKCGDAGYFYKPEENDYEFSIKIFLTIQGKFSFTGMYEIVKEQFPSGDWLPFGLDDGDWIFCISLRESQYGQIYLMRTDEGDEKDAFTYVCASFEEFIEGLENEGE